MIRWSFNNRNKTCQACGTFYRSVVFKGRPAQIEAKFVSSAKSRSSLQLLTAHKLTKKNCFFLMESHCYINYTSGQTPCPIDGQYKINSMAFMEHECVNICVWFIKLCLATFFSPYRYIYVIWFLILCFLWDFCVYKCMPLYLCVSFACSQDWSELPIFGIKAGAGFSVQLECRAR